MKASGSFAVDLSVVEECGELAQMVECLLCMQEVLGSILRFFP